MAAEPLTLVSMPSLPPSSKPRNVPRPATDKKLSDLGQRLKAAWEHAGLTQSSLEAAMVRRGVIGRGYLTRLKYGERGNRSISWRIVDVAAEICGVDTEWLWRGVGRMLPRRQPLAPLPDPDGRTPGPPSTVRGKK